MSPTQIKIELLKRGVKQTDLAGKCGVTPAQVNRVINRGAVSHHVRVAVAKAIKKDVRMVWPQYYLNSQPALSVAPKTKPNQRLNPKYK